MTNPRKTYFLPPSWDYHPSGPIQLGNLILSPSTPADALNGPTCPRPSATSLFPPVLKTNETWSFTTHTTQRYGIFTRLLVPLLGAGVDAGINHATDSTSRFHFAASETREFAPEPGFVRACLAASPAALACLARARFRRHLYMVTAVKVVRGARVAMERARKGGVQVQVGLDGAGAGVPVKLGPEVVVGRGEGESGAFEAAGEFVFAFRVRKVVVRRGTEEVVARLEPYTSGAMYDEQGGVTRGEVDFVVDETACEEASAEGDDAWRMAVEDGEEVVCVEPRL